MCSLDLLKVPVSEKEEESMGERSDQVGCGRKWAGGRTKYFVDRYLMKHLFSSF